MINLFSNKLWMWFRCSCIAILVITGLAKMSSSFGEERVLAMSDPIMGMSYRHLMFVVGVGELVIAGMCLLDKKQKLTLGLLAWLALSYSCYRLGLWWIGWHMPCSCMGNITDALHIKPETADNIMKCILAYMLFGSHFVLFSLWQKDRSVARVVRSPTF